MTQHVSDYLWCHVRAKQTHSARVPKRVRPTLAFRMNAGLFNAPTYRCIQRRAALKTLVRRAGADEYLSNVRVGPGPLQVFQQGLAYVRQQRKKRLCSGLCVPNTEAIGSPVNVAELHLRNLASSKSIGGEKHQYGVVTKALWGVIFVSCLQDGTYFLRAQCRRN